MAIKPAKLMGDPGLIDVSTPVVQFDDALQQLILDLKETMKKEQGIGLAAPQIGCNQRVMIAGFEKSDRYPHVKSIPLQVYVNPEFDIIDAPLGKVV